MARRDAPPVRRAEHSSKASSPQTNGHAAALRSGDEQLDAELCLAIHKYMVRSRAMEERMIKMSKSGEGYFWIGGPGEEAFNVPLGMQVKKGEGPEFDYLHLHYRNSATMLAMGMPMVDGIRQMAMTATDPHSLGRNFPGHFARKDWNVIPVSSVIEIQFAMAPGTAIMQKRRGSDGVTIVVGGDAGTAEGDFATCMIWSTRPNNELPVLMVVMNNGWGISTSHCSQHCLQAISERGKPFGIATEVVNGNDPIASWHAIQRAMEHGRRLRKPFILEAMVSRLYGHSSSSGAPRSDEPDCLELFEEKLRAAGVIDQAAIDAIHAEAKSEADAAVAQAVNEPKPTPVDVEKFTYGPSEVDAVYPRDYTGMP